MYQGVINELNAILKGERMAIESYDRFIANTKDEKLRADFEEIQRDHIKHAGEIAARIEALGSEPDGDTGFTGMMADAMFTIQGLTKKDTMDMLEKAYDGEDKGIAKAEELVRGDLDEESRKLLERIFSEDHQHLSRLAHMIVDYGTRH